MLKINSSEKGIKEVALLRSSKCNDLWRQKGMKVDQLSEFVCTQTYERRMNELVNDALNLVGNVVKHV